MSVIVTSSTRIGAKSRLPLILSTVALAIISAWFVFHFKASLLVKSFADSSSDFSSITTNSIAMVNQLDSPHKTLQKLDIPNVDSTKYASLHVSSDNLASNVAIVSPQPKPTKAVAMPLRQYFDNPIENQLEGLSVRGKHYKSLPVIKLTDEEILSYLRKPVDIYEDDDEKTVKAKEATAEMKAQALAFIEGGGTYQEFVRIMADASNAERELINEVRREKIRLLKEEGVDAATAYLESANKVLKDAGLREMTINIFDTNLAERAAAVRTH